MGMDTVPPTDLFKEIQAIAKHNGSTSALALVSYLATQGVARDDITTEHLLPIYRALSERRGRPARRPVEVPRMGQGVLLRKAGRGV